MVSFLLVAGPSFALEGAPLGTDCAAVPEIEAKRGAELIGSLPKDGEPKSIFFKRHIRDVEATISYWCDGGTVRQQQGSVKLSNEEEAERFFSEQRAWLVERFGPPESDQLDPDNPRLREIQAALDSVLKRLAYWITPNGAFVLMITLESEESWGVELLHN